MKRLFCLLLVVSLMAAMAVPCFAASNSDEHITPYGTSYTSATDNAGNKYRITCNSTVDYYWCSAYTTYRVSKYADTPNIPFEKITKTVTVKSTVYFNNGKLPDSTSISASNSSTSEGATAQDAEEYRDRGFQSLNSDHTFNTSNGLVGGKVFYTSAAMPSV